MQGMIRSLKASLIACYATSVAAVLCPCPADAQFVAIRTALHHEHRVGKMRIFFDTEGVHAVDSADENGDGIPDQVEDVAKQTWAAYSLFVETLGFPDPFQTDRYKTAAFLDIHLLDRNTLGHNGVAYDELQRFRRPQDGNETRTLCFDVATSVKASSNLTPAHEFFHILQNSVTYFKNSWYTEGTARWSERGLGLGGVGEIRYRGPWPLSDEDAGEVFEMRYDSSVHFWNPLAMRDDPAGVISENRVSPHLRRLTYSNGAKVLLDFQLNGWEFIRDVLLKLGEADDVAFRELGYTRWSEDNQKSKDNSRFIYKAVMEVARRRNSPVR
jgi:hypothetical protein